jgi:DNA-binding XRE family transcriptional regulator
MTLKEARLALGLTQAALDKRAGVPRNTTSDIERGANANPSWQIVRELMAALHREGLVGLRAEEIFGGEKVATE